MAFPSSPWPQLQNAQSDKEAAKTKREADVAFLKLAKEMAEFQQAFTDAFTSRPVFARLLRPQRRV